MGKNRYDDHEHETNKLAVNVLKLVSVLKRKTHNEIINEFKNGSYDVTESFWLMMVNFGKYNRLDFCSDCGKFTLYYE